MPRITAKTVKEHRENVQTALVDVTEEILRNEPGTDLTAAAIAKRAGIARNSIYRYVTSVNDLRRLVIERYMPGWMSAVTAATEGIDDPREWLAAWVSVNLEQAVASDHGWMRNVVVSAENQGGRNPHVNATIDNRCSFTRASVDVVDVHKRVNVHLQEVWEQLAPGHGDIYMNLTMAQLAVGFRALEAGQSLDEVKPIVVQAILSIIPSEDSSAPGSSAADGPAPGSSAQ